MMKSSGKYLSLLKLKMKRTADEDLLPADLVTAACALRDFGFV
jgi:hypothetical protein